MDEVVAWIESHALSATRAAADSFAHLCNQPSSYLQEAERWAMFFVFLRYSSSTEMFGLLVCVFFVVCYLD